MVNATGLHASEIVAISQKNIRPFETRILKAIWGASIPGRAKENFFLPHVSGIQNCPLPAGALRPRRLASKALQNTWPSHDHNTSCMGRESPHTPPFSHNRNARCCAHFWRGGLWTAVRAHQRGMITSRCCPYCKQADETEQHILWECAEWAAARDLHIANVRALAAKVPALPPHDRWPPCLKISGLLPLIEPPVNKQVEQHDLPFIQALHAMFVAILAARKLRDQQAPKIFPTVRPQARSAYPYHQLVGPMPPPPKRARYAYTTPPHAPDHGKSPFWQTYWLGCGRYSGRKTQTQCPSSS